MAAAMATKKLTRKRNQHLKTLILQHLPPKQQKFFRTLLQLLKVRKGRKGNYPNLECEDEGSYGSSYDNK